MNERRNYHAGIWDLGTIDGRENKFTIPLREYLSEGALHTYRARVQIENLIALSKSGLRGFPIISPTEERILRTVVLSKFEATDAADYDHFGRNEKGPFEHDVKSVEYALRDIFDIEVFKLAHLKEFIHFPMTSEDVNNIAWNLMLRDAINKVWLPKVMNVCGTLSNFAKKYAHVPILGVTHGMKASPTTFGKRFAYFLERFMNVLEQLTRLQFAAKYSGPTGNHNAMVAAFPDFDIEGYAKSFVESFGFRYESCENQRNSHIEIVRVLNEINLVDIIAADLCENIRHGVMMEWFYLTAPKSTVGSSVMPHKINPWFFEVGQGYLQQATSLIGASGPALIQSVMDRDLTDHPWERAYGEMLGKSLIGLSYLDEGLLNLYINDTKALRDLENSPEVLSEVVQIVGRVEGVDSIYMKIKDATRDGQLTMKILHSIIDQYIPSEESRKLLKQLDPMSYTGKAPQLALDAAKKYSVLQPVLAQGLLHPFVGIQAFLFDFDNTLHIGDKDEVHARLTAISEKMNLGFNKEEITVFGNRSDYKEMCKLMVEAFNNRGVGNRITEDDFQKVGKEVSGTFDHYLTLAEGAMDTLNTLKSAGYKLGLVTTRGDNSLPRLLEKYGITNHFDVVVHRNTKEKLRIKPHPEPIALALSQLGISGKHAVFVGDKQVDDIIAGKALNMQTILVCDEMLDVHGAIPTYHFKNMTQVLKLLV